MARGACKQALALGLGLGLCFSSACSRDEGADADGLGGAIEADGSSTVFPITEAVAEEFQIAHPDAQVTVAFAGTGGGFKRFCADEIDIADASRPISDDEKAACAAAGIEYVEMSVAWDGLSVVVNPANSTVQCLTMEELKKLWEPNSTVKTWKDLRAALPANEIKLYGPGTDSGTFDYFTEKVVGATGSSRADYQGSEDDNILVQGVSGDPNSLGYFGYAYYTENQQRLKVVGVDAGSGCVLPSDATIADSSYPLSRPLFIYVKKSSLERPVVAEFIRFYMDSAAELVPSTGYHPLDAAKYQENLTKLQG